MGATLDVNMICKKFISLSNIMQIVNSSLNITISIKKITIMDNWEYGNVSEIGKLFMLEDFILQDKIACIEFVDLNGSEVGLYIEKEGDVVMYNLWIDTANCPVLDTDFINEINKKYYNIIYKTFGHINKEHEKCIDLVSIGVETLFEFNKDFSKVIANSHNVNSWLISEKHSIDINGYVQKPIDGLGMKVFERING